MDEDEDKDAGPSDSQRLLGNSSPSHYHSLPPSPSAGPVYSGSPAMEAPKDKYNGVYLIFYVLGLGTLLPWNFFITANDYWMFKLQDNTTSPSSTPTPPTTSSPLNSTSGPHPHDDNLNQLQTIFQNTLSVCAMVPTVIFTFVNTLLQQRVPEKPRMIVSLSVMIIIFIVTEVLVKIDVSSWPLGFFLTTMISVVFLNTCSAIFQSCLFGMASKLPAKYIQALMAGQGMGGLFAASAMLVSLALSSGPLASAFAYFLTATVVLFLTMLCYLVLQKNHFYRYYNSTTAIVKTTNAEKTVTPRSNRNSDSEVKKNGDIWVNNDPYGDMKETNLFKPEVDFEKQTASITPPLFTIFKKIWVYYVSVTFVFFITLACFPSITAKVWSSGSPPWSTTYFIPVSCFLLFNLTDWMGRTLAGYVHFPSEHHPYVLLMCCIARGVFPALFALCDVHPRTTPVLFHHDGYFIAFMILFGLSNGYLGTLAMQYGPKRVDLRFAATAGSMLAFGIAAGLAVGAAFSFVIQAAL